MTRTKYTQEQILAVLKEAEAGAAVQDLIRKHGIGQDTFYRWKRLYGGLEREELQRVRALESAVSRAPDAAPGAAGAADGARGGAAAVGLSALVGAAAPRGLPGQLEARLPAVSGVGARREASAAEACGGRAPASATRHAA